MTSKVRPSAKLMLEEDSFVDEYHQLEDLQPEHKDIIEIRDEPLPEPVTPTKRGRGRPRKGESPKKPVAVDLTPRRSPRKQEIDKKREEEEEAVREIKRIEQERRLKLQKEQEEQERRIKQERKMAFDAHNAKLIEQGLDPIPEPEESASPPQSPKKRVTSPKKPETPRKKMRSNIFGSPSPSKGSPERRSKKGRPSKQENVTKEVVSIFQMDDSDIFNKSSPASCRSKDFNTKTPDSPGPISLNFENKGQSSFVEIPTISGIKRPATTLVEQDNSEARKFTPFPLPELDDDGNTKDSKYMKLHLPNVASLLDPNARLADERAFFLDGSEGYFEQHSLRFRPSTNSLAANAPPLDYEEFRPMIALGQLIHKEEKDALRAHQRGIFHQWCMELSQGYNLNFFGVGSKIGIITEFLEEYFPTWYSKTVQDDDLFPGVMIINGYNPSTKLKSVIHDIISVVVSEEEKLKGNFRMPKHVSEAFPFLVSHLKKNVVLSEKNKIIKPKLVLIIHNLDGEAFRDERSQNFLSQLASLSNVWLLASTDHINVGLLWDLYRFKNFGFLWHEVTTHEAYRVEMSFKDVLSAGKSKKFVGTKGVKHVLTSLTANAKHLYRILLRTQLAKLVEMTASKAARTGLRGNSKMGLDLETLYDKCVQEYIVSNKTNFNTMLQEFVEHKMCSLTKSKAGGDIVFIPFTHDEMEKILEEEFAN